MDERPDYGNWVPAPMTKVLWGATAGLGIASVALATRKATRLAGVGCAGITCAAAGMSAYMSACHREFDFEGGALMGQIHQIVVDHLPWDGQGTLLDVGCGAGALTIRCAKAFPQAQMHGVDLWGANWAYVSQPSRRPPHPRQGAPAAAGPSRGRPRDRNLRAKCPTSAYNKVLTKFQN